jgi:uncharacterized membrane protein
MDRDDDHWRGVFYYNPDDSSLWVGKRFGIGWTLNFAHRASWLVLAAMLLLPIVAIVAGVFFVHRSIPTR